jgi:CRP-like cAMP-binding protein
MTEKHKTPAALYLIRQGRVKLVSRARNETLGGMGYFGEETLLHDAETGKNGPSDSTEIDAPYSVEVIEDCRLGVLTLENCRKVFDTICKSCHCHCLVVLLTMHQCTTHISSYR